jgi:DNA-binding GntR family transcriptional regulator
MLTIWGFARFFIAPPAGRHSVREPMRDVIKPVEEHENRVADIAKSLEADVIFGRLEAGDRLVEDALVARFSVSRHFVREALYKLERLGIVTREKNKGATVRALDTHNVRQIYHVRALLQRDAALLIPLPASIGLIDRLEAINATYISYIEQENFRGIHEANEEFHLALFSACNNSFLVETIEYYIRLTLPVRAMPLADPLLLAASHQQHAMMIRYLRGKDSWALAQLCVDHLDLSIRPYLARMEAQAAEGAAVRPPAG